MPFAASTQTGGRIKHLDAHNGVRDNAVAGTTRERCSTIDNTSPFTLPNEIRRGLIHSLGSYLLRLEGGGAIAEDTSEELELELVTAAANQVKTRRSAKANRKTKRELFDVPTATTAAVRLRPKRAQRLSDTPAHGFKRWSLKQNPPEQPERGDAERTTTGSRTTAQVLFFRPDEREIHTAQERRVDKRLQENRRESSAQRRWSFVANKIKSFCTSKPKVTKSRCVQTAKSDGQERSSPLLRRNTLWNKPGISLDIVQDMLDAHQGSPRAHRTSYVPTETRSLPGSPRAHRKAFAPPSETRSLHNSPRLNRKSFAAQPSPDHRRSASTPVLIADTIMYGFDTDTMDIG
jgi:hypothetical protein